MSAGTKVGVFLTSDGVELSRDGSCSFTQVQPLKKLDDLIDGFIEAGGVVWSCAPCFKHRGLDVEQTVEGVIVTGAGPMLGWIREGASVISL